MVTNLLTQHRAGRFLGLDDMVKCGDDHLIVGNVLTNKHPPNVTVNAFLQDQAGAPHDIIFDSLDANLIREATLRTRGASGLSGLNAFTWHRLCTSYNSASINLCKALATVGSCVLY